jgi:hypothetical protein
LYVVDLLRGGGIYFQKCLDPDCRQQRYESVERKIPPEYLPDEKNVTEVVVSLLSDDDLEQGQLSSIDALFTDYEKRQQL